MVQMRQIRELSRRIARRFKPEKIILFGSYAYGKPTNLSDVDMLVILPFEGNGFDKSTEILSKTNPQFCIDLLARRPDDTARHYREFDPLIREAMDKGTVLYERDREGMGREGGSRLSKRSPGVSSSQTPQL